VSLVTLGDLLLDVVAAPERPPEQGTDVPGRVSFRVGGSAANVARAFVRLGGKALLLCAVGDDRLGRELLGALRAEGVRVRAVKVRAATGRLVAVVAEDGDRAFITQRGAADMLRPADVDAGSLRRASIVHIPAYSILGGPIAAASARAVALARQTAALVSVDLSSSAPLVALGADEARRRIDALSPDVLFATRQEASVLVGRGGAAGLGRLLGLAQVVVVKEGGEGSQILWRDPAGGHDGMGRMEVATSRIVAADTTGAGDAFAAGFLLVLARAGEASWRSAATLRRAALGGHRSAVSLLRSARAELWP
jgi:sugar/nucleoside kinase (ribokinase family)